jgi:hypothetical protein
MTLGQMSLILGISLLIGSCGSAGDPMQPTRTVPLLPLPSRLNLQLGPQWLTVIGVNLSNDPEVPPCVPFASPRSGTSVNTAVLVTHEAGDWVARSMTSAAGTIEMRFHESQAKVSGIEVSGSIRGSGSDMWSNAYVAATESRVVFAGSQGTGAATVAGDGDPYFSYVGGKILGTVTYRDRSDQFGTCSVVLWSLLPGPADSFPAAARPQSAAIGVGPHSAWDLVRRS